MKIGIDADEWYPVYSISEDTKWYGEEAEVTEEFFTNARRIFDEFNELQNELEKLYERT